MELRDAFGHLISQLRIKAPSVTYTLRAVAQACLGMRAEGISPEEALKDLKLVEAIVEQRRQKITTDHWMELWTWEDVRMDIKAVGVWPASLTSLHDWDDCFSKVAYPNPMGDLWLIPFTEVYDLTKSGMLFMHLQLDAELGATEMYIIQYEMTQRCPVRSAKWRIRYGWTTGLFIYNGREHSGQCGAQAHVTFVHISTARPYKETNGSTTIETYES